METLDITKYSDRNSIDLDDGTPLEEIEVYLGYKQIKTSYPPTTVISQSMPNGIKVSSMEDFKYNDYDSKMGSRIVNSHYTVIEQIGKGSFGEVYTAKERKTGEIVALKRIIMEDFESTGFPISVIREIKILKELNHENIVNLKEVVTCNATANNNFIGSVFLVFEYMDHDLNGLMDSPSFKHFTISQIKCYLKQLLEGVDYCHRNNLLHRDIKGANILLDNNGILKLADFGLSKPHNSETKDPMTNEVVTLWYRPPELLLGALIYGKEVDMWSVGCVMYELLAKKPLFPGRNSIEQLDKIYKICGTPNAQTWEGITILPFWDTLKPCTYYPRVLKEHCTKENPTFITEDAFDLLDKLLCMDPKKRISASEALDHLYFWNDPRPCNPKDIPKYPSCHEFIIRKNKIEEQKHNQQPHQQSHQQPYSYQFPQQQQQYPQQQQQNPQQYYQSGPNNNYYKKQRTDVNYQSNVINQFNNIYNTLPPIPFQQSSFGINNNRMGNINNNYNNRSEFRQTQNNYN